MAQSRILYKRLEIQKTMEKLKREGFSILSSPLDGDPFYERDAVSSSFVLIIGNEGKGISRLLREECDYVVSLPMVGTVESLNASVSAGIMLYEIYSQRFPL